MTFQTIDGVNGIRNFATLDDATRYFFNATMSGPRCRLYGITLFEAPGPDGRYANVQLLEERS